MPGKTYIPRTTLAAGSNRVNSNFANKLEYNPTVKGMLANIAKLESEKQKLINSNNNLIKHLVDSSLNDLSNVTLPNVNFTSINDISLNSFRIL
jgi:hypothetical protein